MLAVYTLTDLVSNCPNFFIINFEQVYYEIFLSEKSFFKSNCFEITQKI